MGRMGSRMHNNQQSNKHYDSIRVEWAIQGDSCSSHPIQLYSNRYMYRATKKVSCSECSLSSLSLSSAGATRRRDCVVSIVVVVTSTSLPTDDYASGSNNTFYALQEGVRSSNLHNAFGTSGSCRYERVSHKCPVVTLLVNWIIRYLWSKVSYRSTVLEENLQLVLPR